MNLNDGLLPKGHGNEPGTWKRRTGRSPHLASDNVNGTWRVPGRVLWSALVLLGMVLAVAQPCDAQAKPLTLKPVSRRPVSPDGIIPADVLARVGLIRDELELLRFEMGRPTAERGGFLVIDAAPREVYFQAQTLLKKANQLAFEQTGERVAEPEPVSSSKITPFHAWQIVNVAYEQIMVVKRHFKLTDRFGENPQHEETTPTDVFRAIALANREINVLLDRQFTPSDVYREVSLAIKYSARLLGQFPDAVQFPPAPAYERGRRPIDVYIRLIDCYNRLDAIAEYSGEAVLSLDLSRADTEEIRSADVYDMAALLVSDLAHFHAQVPKATPPPAVDSPYASIFPSHAYQQAGILLAQLKELERRVREQPKWLKQ